MGCIVPILKMRKLKPMDHEIWKQKNRIRIKECLLPNPLPSEHLPVRWLFFAAHSPSPPPYALCWVPLENIILNHCFPSLANDKNLSVDTTKNVALEVQPRPLILNLQHRGRGSCIFCQSSHLWTVIIQRALRQWDSYQLESWVR